MQEVTREGQSPPKAEQAEEVFECRLQAMALAVRLALLLAGPSAAWTAFSSLTSSWHNNEKLKFERHSDEKVISCTPTNRKRCILAAARQGHEVLARGRRGLVSFYDSLIVI